MSRISWRSASGWRRSRPTPGLVRPGSASESTRGDLEGLVDVVDRESHAVHADLVRPGGLRVDRVGVDVLEELEATVAVWRLEHGDLGVVAVEADGGVGPLSADRVAAEDGQPEVGEEGDRRFEVADGDA